MFIAVKRNRNSDESSLSKSFNDRIVPLPIYNLASISFICLLVSDASGELYVIYKVGY